MSYLCDLLLNSQTIGFSHLKPTLALPGQKRKVLLVLIYSRNMHFFLIMEHKLSIMSFRSLRRSFSNLIHVLIM